MRCHCRSKGFQLHILCEAQNCVVTVGATAFNYTSCAKHRIALSLVEQRLLITIGVRSRELRCHWWSNGFQLHLVCEAQNCVVTVGATDFNKTCAKHRSALSQVLQRLSITLVVRNTELRCHWWSNGFQLLLLCEEQNCVVNGRKTDFNYTCCAKQNCIATGVATAFNYGCYAKQRIALSLGEQRLSITLVRSKELRCH